MVELLNPGFRRGADQFTGLTSPEYYNDPGRQLDVFNREFNTMARGNQQPDIVYERDPEFNGYEFALGTEDEEDAVILAEARNRAEYEVMKMRLRRERHDLDVLNNTSMADQLLLGGVISIFDPINIALLPMAIPRGLSVAAMLGRNALVGGVAGVGVEAQLQSQRLERTAQESLMNITTGVVGGAAFAGAIVGGGAVVGKTLVGSRTVARAVTGDIKEAYGRFREAVIAEENLKQAQARTVNPDQAAEAAANREADNLATKIDDDIVRGGRSTANDPDQPIVLYDRSGDQIVPYTGKPFGGDDLPKNAGGDPDEIPSEATMAVAQLFDDIGEAARQGATGVADEMDEIAGGKINGLIDRYLERADAQPGGEYEGLADALRELQGKGKEPGTLRKLKDIVKSDNPDEDPFVQRITPDDSIPDRPERLLEGQIDGPEGVQSLKEAILDPDMLDDMNISPEDRAIWGRIIDAIPDHLMERMGVEINRKGINSTVSGFYDWFTDIVTVFTRRDGTITGMDSRNADTVTTPGGVFSHEVGHRILAMFMNEEEFFQAWRIFKISRQEFPDAGANLNNYYPPHEDFSEWFANVVMEYVDRNATGQSRRTDFSTTFLTGDEGQMMRIVKRVTERISTFVRKMKGKFGRGQSYEEMIDNFIGNLLDGISPNRVARQGEDITTAGVIPRKISNQIDLADPEADIEARLIIRQAFDDMAGKNNGYAEFEAKTADIPDEDVPFSRGGSGGNGVPPGQGAGTAGGAASAGRSDIHPTGTGVEDAIRRTSPLLRLLSSPNLRVRRVAAMLLETPFWLKKNWMGKRTDAPVEALVKLWRHALVDDLNKVTDGYLAYYRRQSGDLNKSRTGILFGQAAEGVMGKVRTGDPAKPMSLHEFRRSVGKASRRGDVSEVPEIAQVAAQVRKTRDSMMQEAKDAGLVDVLDPHPSQSHFPRMWEQDVVLARREELLDRILAWQRENHHLLPHDLQELMRKGGQHKAHIEKQLDQISGLNNGLAGLERHEAAAGPKGAFKERSIFMPDDLIDDFLESDIDTVMRQWVQSVSVDVELAKKFGSVDMAEWLKQIDVEYLEELRIAPDQAARDALDKARKQDFEDIIAMRDIMRGTYNIPDFPYAPTSIGARLVLEFNNLTMLGGVALASVPDAMRIVMMNGMATMDVVKLAAKDWKSFKILANEAKLAGVALDMQLQTRALALAHAGDLPGRFTKLEKGMGYLSNAWFIGNMLSPWNAMIKQAAGAATGHRMTKDMRKLVRGTLGKNKTAQLASMGIDARNVRQVLSKIDEFGDEVHGVMLVNSHLWGETPAGLKAQKVWRAALAQEVDAQIVTPGIGDLPLAARRTPGTKGFSEKVDATLGEDNKVGENVKAMYPELGKIFFQYKSFAFGSATRVAVAGLQAKDAKTLHGLMGMVVLGGAVSTLKDISNGRPTPENVGEFLVEGFDQSGVWGWAGNVNTALEALSDNNIGMRPLLGMADPWGSSTKWKVGSVLGPTAGTAVRVGEIAADIAAGDADWRTSRSAYRLIPGNNWFPLKLAQSGRLRNMLSTANEQERASGIRAHEGFNEGGFRP